MFDQCQGEVRIGILTGQEYRGFRALGYFEVIAVRAPCRGTVQGIYGPRIKGGAEWSDGAGRYFRLRL
ncbi:hypothetical protein FE848_14695 [Marinobacter sp. 1-3A]|uniref:hypothetical protein n=1 Tax=Marinobacter sp. 1-3A TaxID=2582920 RepID=UPI00190361DE|nr:hypothetical protein [Marinobacter sp. 1-3A]MBK1874471.1 hypothetical protein [Marinobacter sp. 1-3A]